MICFDAFSSREPASTSLENALDLQIVEKIVAKETKSADELAAMVIAGLRAEGVHAASIEVYRIDEPSLNMNWTVRKLRLEATSEVKVEGAVKRVLFPIANQYDLAD